MKKGHSTHHLKVDFSIDRGKTRVLHCGDLVDDWGGKKHRCGYAVVVQGYALDSDGNPSDDGPDDLRPWIAENRKAMGLDPKTGLREVRA